MNNLVFYCFKIKRKYIDRILQSGMTLKQKSRNKLKFNNETTKYGQNY